VIEVQEIAMPVIIAPTTSANVLLQTISEPWTMADYMGIFAQAKSLLDAATHPLHWIVDLQGVMRDPAGVMRIREHPSFSHPNTGEIIFCIRQLNVRMVVQTAMKLSRFGRLHYVANVEEAWALLRQKHGETIK
jgi:hypothetical protein